jgi:predicted nucleotidyltransferase
MSVSRQPMDVVMGTVTGVRVLRALLAHGGALPVSRLVRETRVSPNGVRDALRQLESIGIVDALGSDRTRLYQARHENPLIPALEHLFDAERQRFGALLDRIRTAAAGPKMVAVWLFGSVARGEDVSGSDVDVAIVIDAPETEVTEIADRVRERLVDAARPLAFSPSVIALSLDDLLRLRNEQAPLWRDLLRDSRVLDGRSPADMARRQDDQDGIIEGRRGQLRPGPSEEGSRLP